MNAPIPLRAVVGVMDCSHCRTDWLCGSRSRRDAGRCRYLAHTRALATGVARLDTNYPERYPSDLTDAEWALRS
jgi:hypothetical protein